jgi:hypothetical protein
VIGSLLAWGRLLEIMVAFVRWSMSSWSLTVICGVALACSACGKSSVKLYPVRGQVLYKNQPAEGAQIVFQPPEQGGPDGTTSNDAAPKQPMAYGSVGKDGSFVLKSGEFGKGAAAGTYNVFVTWYGPDPRNPEQNTSKLPAKYADQSTPVLKVTVKEEDNQLEPFRLN